MGNKNSYLKTEITTLFSKYFPHLNLNNIFTNRNTTDRLFYMLGKFAFLREKKFKVKVSAMTIASYKSIHWHKV